MSDLMPKMKLALKNVHSTQEREAASYILKPAIGLLLTAAFTMIHYGIFRDSAQSLFFVLVMFSIGTIWLIFSLFFKGYSRPRQTAEHSYRTLYNLIEPCSDPIVITDLDMTIIESNDSFEQGEWLQNSELQTLPFFEKMAAELDQLKESHFTKFHTRGTEVFLVGMKTYQDIKIWTWQPVTQAGSTLSSYSEDEFFMMNAVHFIEDQGRVLYLDKEGLAVLGFNLTADVFDKSVTFNKEKSELSSSSGERIQGDYRHFTVKNGFLNILTFEGFSFVKIEPPENTIFHDDNLALLFDTSPTAIAFLNSDLEVTVLNQKFKEVFHRFCKEDETTPIHIKQLITDETYPKLYKLMQSAFRGENQKKRRYADVVFNGGDQLQGQVHIIPLLTKHNTINLVLYFYDKSQERNLEIQFVQAQKMQAVGQLAGGVAHDFNNLLTAIIGFCDLLLTRHVPGDQSFADINQIKQNANRAANLVRQLLAFSRQQTLRPKVLNIADVLTEVSHLIRRLIGETIDFQLNLSRDLPEVRADQGQLEQVMINLAVNARDAMNNNGTLILSTRMASEKDKSIDRLLRDDSRDFIVIEVEDTGSGISEEVQEKMFDPFFTTKGVGEGTGLGLSTVYGIVKQTDGYIFVDSKLGSGTTFKIYLPLYEPSLSKTDLNENTVVAQVSKAKDLTGQGTILLVEDEVPVRMFATRALSNKGYVVLEAGTGEEALEILKTSDKDIDLLVTDVIMPNMDGPTLYKESRKLFPKLPVIFISGYAEDVFRGDLEGDDFEFLAKPFSLVELAEKVKNTIK
ncbi:response regulator [Temperatibacter marinus]|uniref:histidine kinase n=1 Tax=Temperatibacter marinus TaxID=1456591 RepID=A0AA52EGL0_9PROT|nr:ATP-binding protein [Temperatibacter marinus]WND02149.1 response regulator [Temperatibacter marinus]